MPVGEDLRQAAEFHRCAVDALGPGGDPGCPGNPHELVENPVLVVGGTGHHLERVRPLAWDADAATRYDSLREQLRILLDVTPRHSSRPPPDTEGWYARPGSGSGRARSGTRTSRGGPAFCTSTRAGRRSSCPTSRPPRRSLRLSILRKQVGKHFIDERVERALFGLGGGPHALEEIGIDLGCGFLVAAWGQPHDTRPESTAGAARIGPNQVNWCGAWSERDAVKVTIRGVDPSWIGARSA